MIFLYPSDLLNPKVVDEAFRPEALACQTAGHTVLRVNTDSLERRGFETVLPFPAFDQKVQGVYRGWMLTPDTYSDLASRLAAKNVCLATSPQQYQRSHELPGWIDEMREYTAKTVELEATELAPVKTCLDELKNGKVFLRDYSKSVKSDPAASIIEAGAKPTEALETLSRFTEARGEVSGHIVFRTFEDYTGPEIRTWWAGSRHLLSTPHPDSPGAFPAFAGGNFFPSGFGEALSRLGLAFCTADFALRSDGVVRLIEIGDGGVSGLPGDYPLDSFVNTVLSAV